MRDEQVRVSGSRNKSSNSRHRVLTTHSKLHGDSRLGRDPGIKPKVAPGRP